MTREITWQVIASRDPFLAGAIPRNARSWEWWMEETAEGQADAVGLSGEPRAQFLQGWHYELDERERTRKGQLVEEYDEMGKDYTRGDPAAW